MSYQISRYMPVLAAALIAVGCAGAAGAANLTFASKHHDIDTKNWSIASNGASYDGQSCRWQAKNATLDGNELQLALVEDQEGEGQDAQKFIGCAQVSSVDSYSYGRYEAHLKAVSGSGVKTVFSTYAGPMSGSSTHDEISIQIPGNNTQSAILSYYTNGKLRDKDVVKLGFDASQGFHTYAIYWRPARVQWFIDGVGQYESTDDAVVPQTPGHIYLGLWSGSAADMGTFSYKQPEHAQIEWVRYTPLATK
ncbi:MAG TPA: family 16 glycosylhydrolase [Rickettsiales bacterium]|nr:family 16 glycosylhydrolase [Rickettsiales bacterium]